MPRSLDDTLRAAAGFCRILDEVEKAHLTSDEERMDTLLSVVDLAELRRVVGELELAVTVRELPQRPPSSPETAASGERPLAAVSPHYRTVRV